MQSNLCNQWLQSIVKGFVLYKSMFSRVTTRFSIFVKWNATCISDFLYLKASGLLFIIRVLVMFHTIFYTADVRSQVDIKSRTRRCKRSLRYSYTIVKLVLLLLTPILVASKNPKSLCTVLTSQFIHSNQHGTNAPLIENYRLCKPDMPILILHRI